MKKLLSSLILACMCTSYTVPVVMAQDSLLQDVAFTQQSAAPKLLTRKTEKELKSAISKLYGADMTEEVYSNLLKIAQTARDNRSIELKEQDKTRVADWYKDEIIYMFYTDRFGVVTPEKPNQFKDTEKMLDYLSDLGVTTLYILPFAESPMGDAGFDVNNPDNGSSDKILKIPCPNKCPTGN